MRSFDELKLLIYTHNMVQLLSFISLSNALYIPGFIMPHNELTYVRATTLIDLSYPYDENTVHWPGTVNFKFIDKIAGTENGFWYASNDFQASEHGGTHIDAPYHFNEKGWKVSDIPVEKLFAINGIKIDAQKEAAADPNYGLEVKKLTDYVQKNGNITSPTVIVVDFGWAKKYPDKNIYFGSKTLKENDLNFPGISFEAAKWIAGKENIIGIGLDTPSADTGSNSINPQSHISLTGANKYILENLALDGVKLPENGFKLQIMPMKIREGTGAPCRVVASVPKF